jgi:SAM-dependent methyltransferase
MANTEDKLWWYKGLRGSLKALLNRHGSKLPKKPVILDAGCGTGANLRFMREQFPEANISGFDLNPSSLSHTREKNPDLDIYESDICQPELKHDSYDLIYSMDVLYMIGVDKSFDGLKKMIDALEPGGLFIINTPALRWLYSEHDVAVHTVERLHASDMKKLAQRLGLECQQVSYRCFYLFPLIVLSRLPTMFGRAPKTAEATSDTALPNPLINSLFSLIMAFENWVLGWGLSYPWGSSVIMVARKPSTTL